MSPGVAECACGIVYKHPTPSQDELHQLYNMSWSEPDRYRSETGGLRAERARLTCNFLTRVAPLTGRVLDYGAGQGHLSAEIMRLGAEVTAVDPYSHASLRAMGIDAHADLDAVIERRFDGIVISEVIEHLREPWHFLREARSMLSEGGWLYLTTPNARGLNARLSGPRWRELQKQGHLVLFTATGLERMLADAGFETISRLDWRFPGKTRARTGLGYVLQACHLDGALRYLAFAPSRSARTHLDETDMAL